MKTALFFALFTVNVTAASPKILDAIAMVETGANTPQRCAADRKRGAAGEVSRYQIKPTEWKRLTKFEDFTNPHAARSVAQALLIERMNAFITLKNRPPTTQEIYLLWNAPAYLLGGGIVPVKLRERCKRFANLLEK